jgi:SAM-dependent methyltransferase
MVQGFVQSPPNDTLMAFAASCSEALQGRRREALQGRRREALQGCRPETPLGPSPPVHEHEIAPEGAHYDGRAPERRKPRGIALDIGCGAGRNAIPLALAGWRVVGTDNSRPMLDAARDRARQGGVEGVVFLEAGMDALPVADASADLIIAHGIWNLARSSIELRSGIREAARAARAGAALFLFTFSRNTLPADAAPEPGETFVFTQFSGEPQVFLRRDEIVAELGAAGFVPDPAAPLTELNARTGVVASSGPVIYQGAFRFAR